MLDPGPMLAFSLAPLAVGLALAVYARALERRRVGHPFVRVLPGRGRRLAGAAALLALGALGAAAPGDAGDTARLAAPPVAVLAAALCVLRPGAGDRVCGTDGVRAGWRVRGFTELESWRLTGDHLRVRLGDAWSAVPLPAAQQAPVRALLEALVPERESPFDR